MGTQEPAAATRPAATVRVAAQRLDGGRVEFAVQHQQPDGSWGDRLLPRARYLPADARTGRWLHSTPLHLPAPQPPPAPPAGPRVADRYWSDDRAQYYVLIDGIAPENTYCEAHLTRDGRRTGEWSNELWSGPRTQVTVSFYLGRNYTRTFDNVEIDCA